MKITLILAAPPNDPLRRNDPFMPLSLPLLAALAPDHEYRLVDLLWDDGVDYGAPVDLVGISMRALAEDAAFGIADRFRQRGVKVVLGGPHASAIPHRAILHADAVAVGEGEPLWPVIVKDAVAGNLRSFYVCAPAPFDGQGRSVYQVQNFPDLAGLPAPLRSLMPRKYTFATTFAARGCPVGCDFCSVTGLFGAQTRLRPVDQVIADIQSLRSRYFYLLDDTVFGRPGTYDYYRDLYARMDNVKGRRYWTGQGNLDAAADPRGREVIRAAARAGLIYAAIGMESVNPATLDRSGSIRKVGARDPAQALDRMREHIRFIQDQGIIVSGWFVVGYESDDLSTYDRALAFCRETSVVPVIFPLRALPGTPLYDRLSREGRINGAGRINILHPRMREDEALAAHARTLRRGYALPEILKRTAFYWRKFPNDRIHRTIFALVLQSRICRGVDVSR